MVPAPPIPDSDGTLRYGRYLVLRRPEDGSFWELGRGGMGVTYKAEDPELRRTVALKVILPALFGNDVQARARFRREARAAAGVHHPHVATVFDIGEARGEDYYVMEYIAGEDLLTRLKRTGTLEVPTVLRLARQVTEALDAAWQQRIVHRDLKPENLMLVARRRGDGDGRGGGEAREERLLVKVVDFGLAKALRTVTGMLAANPADSLGLAGSVRPVFSPAYASPEQIEGGEGHELDVRSDLYSLGVTLWHCLVGQPTFGGTSQQRAIVGHLTQEPPVATLHAAGVPAGVVALLVRLLAKDPAERPDSPEALLEDLDRLLLVGGNVVPPPGSAPPPPPPVLSAEGLLTPAKGLSDPSDQTTVVGKGIPPPFGPATLPGDDATRPRPDVVANSPPTSGSTRVLPDAPSSTAHGSSRRRFAAAATITIGLVVLATGAVILAVRDRSRPDPGSRLPREAPPATTPTPAPAPTLLPPPLPPLASAPVPAPTPEPTPSAFDRARRLREEATRAYDAHSYQLAVEKYSDAIALNPDDALVYHARGNAYGNLQQPGRAIEDFTRAIALDPGLAPAYKNRGIAYRALKQPERAIEDFTKAIALEPKFAPAYGQRGLAYGALGQNERALEDLTQAIALDPNFALAYYGRGNAYSDLKQPERAVQDFTRSIELDANFTPAYLNRGASLYKLKQLERALEDFTWVIALDPKNSDAHRARGLTYRDLKQPELAVEDYTRAIALEPKDARAYRGRSIAYQMLGERAQAERDLAKAKELDPKIR